MRDRWMNVGYEEEELKPYIEPQPDYKDPRRTGRHKDTMKKKCILLFIHTQAQLSIDVFFLLSYENNLYFFLNYSPKPDPAV